MTPTHIPTETPTNTSPPSPNATIPPDFTSTQQAIDLQETQIAQETQTEILAQETRIAAEATSQAESTLQAIENAQKEQIDKFYNAAREQLGIEIVKDPELISNNSKVLSFYLSQKLFDKNINSIHFYKEFQDLYGYYLLGRIAGQQAYYYDQDEFASLDKYVDDKCTHWDLDGWSKYAENKFRIDGGIATQGINVHDQQVNMKINHLELQIVSKREFEQLLKLAQEQELSLLFRGNGYYYEDVSKAMVLFQGTKMIAIGYFYDPAYPISAEHIGNWSSNEEKLIYFQTSLNQIFSGILVSIAGDKFTNEYGIATDCDRSWEDAHAVFPMKPGDRESSTICNYMNCDKIAEQTFK